MTRLLSNKQLLAHSRMWRMSLRTAALLVRCRLCANRYASSRTPEQQLAYLQSRFAGLMCSNCHCTFRKTMALVDSLHQCSKVAAMGLKARRQRATSAARSMRLTPEIRRCRRLLEMAKLLEMATSTGAIKYRK